MTLFQKTFIILLLFSTLFSCKKEEEQFPVELLNPIESYEQINNYFDVALNLHFTSYFFRCKIINHTGASIEKVVVNFEYSNGASGAFIYKSNLFDVIDGKLSFKVPIRFNTSSNCTLYYRIITDNNEQSNMVFNTLNKPENAF